MQNKSSLSSAICTLDTCGRGCYLMHKPHVGHVLSFLGHLHFKRTAGTVSFNNGSIFTASQGTERQGDNPAHDPTSWSGKRGRILPNSTKKRSKRRDGRKNICLRISDAHFQHILDIPRLFVAFGIPTCLYRTGLLKYFF